MNKPVLLSIDDDQAVLSSIQQDLRTRYSEDYRVMGVDSGAEGLGLAEELRKRGDAIALFLSDQRMPGMTGIEFLDRVAELYPEAKRTLLTAYADTEVAIRAINDVRLDHYLMKPWDPPEEHLYPTLDDLLDAHGRALGGLAACDTLLLDGHVESPDGVHGRLDRPRLQGLERFPLDDLHALEVARVHLLDGLNGAPVGRFTRRAVDRLDPLLPVFALRKRRD